MNLVKHITEKIEFFGLEKAKFLLAISGGEDSMVLLHAFHKSGFHIRVAHVNYQLRGDESDLDQKLVEDYCKANSIEFSIKKAIISENKGIQEKARNLRFSWFQSLLGEFQLDYVVTAHHLNDSVETTLFNLLRGSGLSGLSGISVFRDELFRPLIDIEKQHISTYQKENNVPFRLDQSNLSVKYSRNKIRNQIFPLFYDVNSQFMSHISNASSLMSEGESALEYVVNEIWDSNMKLDGLSFKLDLGKWKDLSFSRSILYGVSLRVGLNPTEAKESINLLTSSSGKVLNFKEYKVWRERTQIVFQKLKESKSGEFYLEIPVIGEYELPNGKINLCTVKNLGVSTVNSYELISRVEDLKWPLIIRTWRPGDRFQPFGMKGTQKVSDLLIQKKVSASEKNKVLILESEGEILWVIGLRSSEMTRVSENSQYYLKALISN